MTVSELIELLEDYKQMHGDDCEVRLMTQQHYPFENQVRGVCDTLDMEGEYDEDDDALGSEDDPICYIVEGQQLGYGRQDAWDVVQ